MDGSVGQTDWGKSTTTTTGVPRSLSSGGEAIAFPDPTLPLTRSPPLRRFGVGVLARQGVNPNLTLNSAPPSFRGNDLLYIDR